MPDRTTAIHYLKIAVPADSRKRIADKIAKCALVVSHPRYSVRQELGRMTLQKLSEDLA
jgi:hypothetical protein